MATNEDLTKKAGKRFKGGFKEAGEMAQNLGSLQTKSIAEKQMEKAAIRKRIANQKMAAQRQLAASGQTRQNLATSQFDISKAAGQSLNQALGQYELGQQKEDRAIRAKRESLIMGAAGNVAAQAAAEEASDKQLEYLKEAEQMKLEAETARANAADDKVICTQTMHQGLLCPVILKADEAYGRTLPREVMIGYHSWGRPVARTMKKFPILTYILAPFSKAWAYEAAFRFNGSGKSNLLGRFLLKVGIPFCKWLGRSK